MKNKFYDFSVSKIEENGRTISLSSIAVPKFFEIICMQILGTVNTLMLSGYSQEAVAATSIAGQILSFATSLLGMVIAGATILTSIELGKKDRQSAGLVGGTAAIMVVSSSVVLGLIMILSANGLVGLMNLEGSARTTSVNFLSIKAGFLIVSELLSCVNSLLICNGYAVCTFITGMTCNILNAAFGYVVLYTDVPLPVGGAEGVALASVLAQIIALALAMFFLLKKKCPMVWGFRLHQAKRILRVGIPSGMVGVSYCISQIISTGFIAGFGLTVVNAKVYVENIIAYTSKLGEVIGQGNSVLVGRYRGAGKFDEIKTLFRQNLRLAILCNMGLSLIVLIFYKPLVGLFTDDPSVIALAGTIMVIDIFVEIGRAINHVSEQSLSANGDTRTCFIASVLSCWLCSVLLGYLLGVKLGMGLPGVWIGFAASELFKGGFYLIRWKSGAWMRMNV